MKTEVKKIDKLKRVLTVIIDEEQLINEKKQAYLEIGKSLKVSGFRPGTAPLDVLEKQYSGLLKDEFLKRKLGEYYAGALKDNNLHPAGHPRIYDVEFTDKLLKFCAEFEIKPEIEIEEGVYKKIKIKEGMIEVGAAEVEKGITNFKEAIKKMSGNDLSDEDLAKWAGYPDIAAFKEAIKAEITLEKLKERKRKIESQVSKLLIEKIKFELPKSELEEHHRQLIERELYYLRMRNIPEEDIEKYKKEIEDKLKPLAEDELRLSYILSAIAQKENLRAEHDLGDLVFGYILSQAEY